MVIDYLLGLDLPGFVETSPEAAEEAPCRTERAFHFALHDLRRYWDGSAWIGARSDARHQNFLCASSVCARTKARTALIDGNGLQELLRSARSRL